MVANPRAGLALPVLQPRAPMPQLFSPRADRRFRLAAVILPLLALLLLGGAFAWARSGAAWKVGEAAPQPIPFSHAIHAGGLGLQCGFCHVGATQAADAGLPAGETCLSCHQRLWNVTAQFAPLRQEAIPWASVHRLPDHVRFHHGAHAQAGIGCTTCHGAVETMPRTVKAETQSMGWCLDCHRGAGEAVAHQGAVVPVLSSCTVCHR